jgi:DNA-binding GntR family transcriptional regulator
MEDELVQPEPIGQIERATTLGRQATELIRRAIIDGTLPAGAHISLREIASRLGVSQTPVREALMHLEAIGFVRFPPGRIQIAEATPDALRAAFELREALEGMAAGLAAQRRTSSEAANIERLARESMKAAKAAEVEPFRQIDVQFHRSIGVAAHSEQLNRYLINALDLALTLRNLRTAGRTLDAAAAPMHLLIAEAITAGDSAAAEAASRQHVRTVAERVIAGTAATVPTAEQARG